MDRRKFIAQTCTFGIGSMLLTGIGFLSEADARHGKGRPKKHHPNSVLPLPYTKLNPDKVSKRAYDYYRKGHCAYGVFASILDELKEKIGAPYIYIPSELFLYGRSGIMGWGTVCGTLNGASAIITLTCKDFGEVINNLFEWYTKSPLPDYTPENKKKYPESVSGSPLCHISVMKWCKTAGKHFKCEILYNSKQRSERCARLTASVVKKTVNLLNDYHASRFKPVTVKGNYKTKMTCTDCHQKEEV